VSPGQPISINTWSCGRFREPGEPDEQFWPRAIAAVAAAGVGAWEPAVVDPDDLAQHKGWAAAAGLAVPSAYFGARMHTTEAATAAVSALVSIGEAGAPGGLRILVVNADPESWTLHRAKSDPQLRTQVAALREAGQALSAAGVRLAYHWHIPEFLAGATEANHMMLATTASELSLCLDVHWTWHSCGASNVAVENALLGYGDRIVALHLRQSRDGIWTQTLCDGDVDYAEVSRATAASNPLLVIEQAPGEGVPTTLDLRAATAANLAWVRATFPFAGPIPRR
jgi:inosose dehydratase